MDLNNRCPFCGRDMFVLDSQEVLAKTYKCTECKSSIRVKFKDVKEVIPLVMDAGTSVLWEVEP